MFLRLPAFFLLSLLPLVALAGSPQKCAPVRFKKQHRRPLDRNIAPIPNTDGVPEAQDGPMNLVDLYAGKQFFDEWDFFTDPDPTHGTVHYVSKEEAFSLGLASVGSDDVVTIAVDDNSTVPLGGNRKSVRITSQKTYSGGLFVLDVNAMPTGCSIWPAFWTVAGQDWPTNGEIDIIEGVNTQSNNQMTLHTAPGCTLDTTAPPINGNAKAFSGRVLSTTCDALANSNTGCGILDSNRRSFGAGINHKGGAVYAMLWDSIGIRIWYFDHSNVPPDLAVFAPIPSSWSIPAAFWSSTTCPVGQFFKEHNIVINTSICGDFAGSAYPRSGCPNTCAEHVVDPKNFKHAKWKINYVATYLWPQQ